MQASLTEEDLKDKDIAEAVDCIVNRFGGLKAVQRELRNRGAYLEKCLSCFKFFLCFKGKHLKAIQDLLRQCSGIFDRPSISDAAESCRGVHLPCAEERAFATDSLHERQHHLPADTTGQRHRRPESDPLLDSSSSIYSCSNCPRQDQKDCKFQTCKRTGTHAVTLL